MKKKEKQKQQEPKKEPEDKKMTKLVKEVEEFNPDFIKYLKAKGLVKG